MPSATAVRDPFHLTPGELDLLLTGAFDDALAPVGFRRARSLTWARNAGDSIVHVIAAMRGRGAGRSVCWGISVPEGPHLVRNTVKWGDVGKDAALDLAYEPHNFPDSSGEFDRAWTVYPAMAPPAAEKVARMAARLGQAALPWLDQIQDADSLVAAFERERARPGGQFSFEQHFQWPLSFAFALARSSAATRAIAEFDSWRLDSGLPLAVLDDLHARLVEGASSDIHEH